MNPAKPKPKPKEQPIERYRPRAMTRAERKRQDKLIAEFNVRKAESDAAAAAADASFYDDQFAANAQGQMFDSDDW